MSSSQGGRGNFPLVFQLQVQGDTEVTSKFNNVGTAMERVSPAAAKMQTGVTGASNSLTGLGTAAQKSTGGVNTFSGALSSFSGNTQTAVTRTQGFAGALGGFNTALGPVQGGLNQSNTLMGNFGNTTQQSGSKVQGVAETFRSNRGIIFALTGIAVAGQEAIGMFGSLQDAQERMNEAQAEVNRLQAEGKEGTKEYNDAQKELADVTRGYNFILKSTVSSFTDMIPFALLLTSSFMDISLRAGGARKVLTKLGGVVPKITKAFRGLGTAIGAMGLAGAFSALASPIGIVTALVLAAGAAIMALAHNFMGFRDAVHGAGQSLGDAVPRLKTILEPMGQIGDQLLDNVKNFTSFGQTASAESQTVKQQMEQLSASGQQMGKILPDQWAAVQEALKSTKDATVLSVNDQIEAMERMGDEAEDVTFSLAAHYTKQQRDQQAHSAKYKDFVTAITTGDEEIMQSMGLTQSEYEEFYKQWESELKAFEEKHNAHVEAIMGNWERFNESQTDNAVDLVDEIDKLEAEIQELTQSTWDMDDDEEILKTNQEIVDLNMKVNELRGTVGDAAYSAAADLKELGVVGTQALRDFGFEVLGGDFDRAIDVLRYASDDLPSKYQGNFDQINSVIGNTALTNRQKVAQIVSDYGTLENAFQPIIAGAYEYSFAQAQLVSNFDELAVAARAQTSTVEGMEGAWTKFLGSLTEEQKQLPIIEDLIARVDAGTISYSDALAEAEAAGRKLSATIGETVVGSFEEMAKTVIDLPGNTTAVFGEIGGQIVKLGEVADSELVSNSDSVVQGLSMVANEAENVATTSDTQLAQNTTGAFSTMGGEGQTAFGALVDYANQTIDVFKTISDRAQTYLVTGMGGKVQTASEKFEELKTAVEDALTYIADTLFGEGNLQNTFAGLVDYISNTVSPNVVDAVSSIGTDITNLITKDGSEWWKGFRDGFASDLGWVTSGMIDIAQDVTGYITKNKDKWWTDFQDAFYATGSWLTNGLSKVGTDIVTYMSNNKDNFWTDFRNALGSSTDWVGDQLGKVSNAITTWEGWTKTGEDIWASISTAIGNAAESAKSAFEQAGDWVGGGFDSFIKFLKGEGGGNGSVTQNATLDPRLFEEESVPGGMTIQEIQQLQQAWSTFSTSIATYSQSIKNNLGILFQFLGQAIPMADNLLKAHQQTWSNFSTSMATYATSMKNNLGIFFAFAGEGFPMLDNLIKAHQQTWSGFSTSISTYANSMKTNVSNFLTAVSQGFNSLNQIITTHRANWSNLSTSVNTYTNSMRAGVASFASATASYFGQLRGIIQSFQSVASRLSTSWRTYMSSMSSSVRSFASQATSAFRSAERAADSLVSALRRVESQARSAARAASGVRGFQHGGAAIVTAQQGFSGIVSAPSTYKGIRMGEGFSPELVTVTPLTRGTGNHFGPTMGSGGGGGGRPVEIHIHNILDGREIGRFVNKVALEDIGIQI